MNGNKSEIWHDVESEVASKLIEGSSSWTRDITREQFSSLYSFFEADWIKTLELLGQDISSYDTKTGLKSNPAPLDDIVREMLKPSEQQFKARVDSALYNITS